MSNAVKVFAAVLVWVVVPLPAARAGSPTSRPATRPSGPDFSPMIAIKQMMADHQYADALAPLQRMMSLHGHDADSFSRHEVLMLVAECRLQLHRVPDSLSALDLAAREAAQDKDWPHRAEALSLATLLRTAPGLTYAPQSGGDHAPLDLTDAAQRSIAYAKLYEDKRAYCDDQMRAAREYESLAPLLEIATAFAASRALEEVTTNSTRQSDAQGDLLAKWSQEMIEKTLHSFSKRIDGIVAASNVGMKGRVQRGPAGLTAEERGELADIDATCKRIPAAVDALDAEFARPLMTNWANARTYARNISTRAETILEADQRIVRNRK